MLITTTFCISHRFILIAKLSKNPISSYTQKRQSARKCNIIAVSGICHVPCPVHPSLASHNLALIQRSVRTVAANAAKRSPPGYAASVFSGVFGGCLILVGGSGRGLRSGRETRERERGGGLSHCSSDFASQSDLRSAYQEIRIIRKSSFGQSVTALVVCDDRRDFIG